MVYIIYALLKVESIMTLRRKVISLAGRSSKILQMDYFFIKKTPVNCDVEFLVI